MAAFEIRTVVSQIVAALSCSEARFNLPAPVWREVPGNRAVPVHSPGWVLTKTIQHTREHGNTIIRIALAVAS